jgi:hypothetical protein
MSETAKPLPRVSAKHYAAAPADAAMIRFRLKGETTGPVYQGQKVIIPCASCGSKTTDPAPPHPF